jgi:hypothetical protein
MSAGQFIRSFYETNGGAIARIRVQPETELANLGGTVNDAPAGPPTVATTVKVSKSRRQYGIGPRKVGIVFDDGQAPAGYEPGNIYYIPVLTRDVYDSFVVGDTATYLSGTADIVSKLEESVK